MTRLIILLSFDHELSLGGAKSYGNNLFYPTYKILDLANQLEVPITLFTDVLSAKRFKEWDERGFYKPYIEQIAEAQHNNHDVQLHIHPHWIDSDYIDGNFIPSESYQLSDYFDRKWPYNIQGIVNQSVNLLTDLCRRNDSQYKCIAFRAGGYGIAPNTDIILSSLYENGIRIETTVTKGFYFKSGISEIDFRNMPKSANWYISPQGPLEEEADDGLFEIPIAGRSRGFINNLPFLMKRIVFRKRRFRSGGIGLHERYTSKFEKLSRLFPNSAWMLGFDNYTDSVGGLLKIVNYHIDNHLESETIICSSISHPKSMGNYSLSLMEGFIQEVRRQHKGTVEFSTFRRIYDEFGLENK